MNTEISPRRVCTLLWWGLLLGAALLAIGTARGETWVQVQEPDSNPVFFATVGVTANFYIEKDVDYSTPGQDRLRVRADASLCADGWLFNLGAYHVSGTWDLIGGTGATGSAYNDVSSPFVVAAGVLTRWYAKHTIVQFNPNAGDTDWMLQCSWTATGDSQTGAVAMKSLPWTMTNSKNYDVRVEIYDDEDNLIQSTVVPALQTVSMDTLSTVLTWEAADGNVTAKVRIPANYANGGWTSVALGDGDASDVVLSPGPVAYMDGDGIPLEPVTTIVMPDGAPANGTLPPSSQPVWAAGGDTSPLENGIYKQGVEKQVAELSEIKDLLSGDGLIDEPAAGGYPATSDNTFAGENSAANIISDVEALLPDNPGSVLPTSIGSDPSISFTIPFLPALGNKTLTIDYSFMTTEAGWLRGLVLTVMSLCWFVIVVRLLRSAFVDA